MPISKLLPFFMLVLFSQADAQLMYPGGNAWLSENLNSLPTSTAFQNLDGTWIDNVTMVGGYRHVTTDGTPGVEHRWRIDNGGAPGGSLYCYGDFGSTDRSLGFVTSTNLPRIDIGLRIRNASQSTLTDVEIEFFGEQWRLGTAGSTTIAFSFGIGVASLMDSTFQASPNLDFQSPHHSGVGSALNGNLSDNRVQRNGVMSGVNWAPGTDLWLRWTSFDAPAGDHGLSVDDFKIRSVPEPSILVALLLLLRRRRR